MHQSSILVALGQTCQRYRKQARVKMSACAASIGRDTSVLSRFEAGTHWPRDIDHVVQGYATIANMHPGAIWIEAGQRLQVQIDDHLPVTDQLERFHKHFQLVEESHTMLQQLWEHYAGPD